MSQSNIKKQNLDDIFSTQRFEEIKFLQEDPQDNSKQQEELSWIKKGEKCWLKMDKHPLLFLKGEIIDLLDISEKKVKIKIYKEPGEEIQVIKGNVQILFMRTDDLEEKLGKTKNDMVDLECLNEPELLNNIRIRYIQNLIYTYVGPTLIVCNPFQKIVELNSEETVYLYYEKIIHDGKHMGNKTIPPHIFAVSAQSYNDIFLNSEDKNQALVISGESGSGKTETTKHAMKFLTSVGRMAPDAQERLTGIKNENLEKQKKDYKNIVNNISSVENRILSCNPILEAFGNAKTTRNNNSSRFGKLITLIIKKRSKYIIGAQIENYLLEKARVTNQGKDERNFHVFYLFLIGADQEFLNKYLIDDIQSISDIQKYDYLNQSGCITHLSLDDKTLFKELIQAFDVLKFEEYTDTIFKLISAILFMGNIEWDESTYDGQSNGCTIKNKQLLKKISTLLDVDEQELQKNLGSFTRFVQSEIYVTPLQKNTADVSVRSFSKFLYFNLFNWIVQKCNKQILPDEPEARNNRENSIFPSISILDIYGFEVFEKNGLDQFFINYTNEKLQSLYIQYIFEQEKTIFIDEQLVDFLHLIKFTSNQGVIDLLDNPKNGIFDIMDDSCTFQNPSDSSFYNKICKEHNQNSFFSQKKLTKCQEFIIHHSVKSVIYSADGFLDKNMDSVQYLALKMISESKNQNIQSIYKVSLQQFEESRQVKGSAAKTKYLGFKFRQDMVILMKTLIDCDCYFIRCIKSNDVKKPSIFESHMVQDQIRSLGVLETIKVRKESYPIRRLYMVFYRKYYAVERKFIPFEEIQKQNPNFQELTKELIKKEFPTLMKKNEIDPVILFGRTRIFMKLKALNFLEFQYAKKMEVQNRMVIKIQKMLYRVKMQRRVTNSFKKIIYALRLARAYKKRKQNKMMRRFIQKMKDFVEFQKKKKLRKKLLNSTILLQSCVYLNLDRAHWVHVRKCVLKIQSLVRMYLKRIQYLQIVRINKLIKEKILNISWLFIQTRACIVIQRLWRGFWTRQVYAEEVAKIKKAVRLFRENKASLYVQKNWKKYYCQKNYLNMKRSAIKIQSWIRMIRTRFFYKKLKESTIKIQHCVRRWLGRKHAIEERLNEYFEDVQLNDKLSEELQYYNTNLRMNTRYQNKLQELIEEQQIESMNNDFTKYQPNIISKKGFQQTNNNQQLQQINLSPNKVISLYQGIMNNNHFQQIQQTEVFSQKEFEIFDANYQLLLQNKIYLFTHILDIEFLSDPSDIYLEPWTKTHQDFFMKSYHKQNYISSFNIGETHTIFSNQLHKLYSFGWNDYGQLGQNIPSYESSHLGIVNNIEKNEKFIQISTGSNHNIGVTQEGKLQGWGLNDKQQLLKDDENFIFQPTTLPLQDEFRYVKCHNNLSYVVNKDFQVYEFGYLKLRYVQPLRLIFPKILKIIYISCGNEFTIFLSSIGILFSQGSNNEGQLGLGDTDYREGPTMLTYLKDSSEKVINISSGYQHSICRCSSGRIYTWGKGAKGQLGHGHFNNEYNPRQMKFQMHLYQEKIIQVIAGRFCSLMLQNDGKILWFGTNGRLNKQKTHLEVDFHINPLCLREDLFPVKITSSYSQTLSVIFITYALTSKIQQKKTGDTLKIRKNLNILTQKWIENNLDSINPPYVEPLANVISHSNMQFPSDKKQSSNKKESQNLISPAQGILKSQNYQNTQTSQFNINNFNLPSKNPLLEKYLKD